MTEEHKKQLDWILKLMPVILILLGFVISVRVMQVQIEVVTDRIAEDRADISRQVESNRQDIRGLIISTTNLLSVQQQNAQVVQEIKQKNSDVDKSITDLRLAIERLNSEVRNLSDKITEKKPS